VSNGFTSGLGLCESPKAMGVAERHLTSVGLPSVLGTCLFSSRYHQEKGRLDLIIQFKTLEGEGGSPRHRNQSVGLSDFWQSKQGNRLFSKALS